MSGVFLSSPFKPDVLATHQPARYIAETFPKGSFVTFEMIFVSVVVVAAVVLFATEKLRVDLVALMVMGVLLLSGIVTPEEGLAGFSNSATVTVGAMFILSAGLFRTGAVNSLGNLLVRLFKGNFWIAVTAMMLMVGVASAFINNTAVVAMLLPVMLGLSRETGIKSSKLLMPLSFASMFGGVCTLLGTSTNILVNSIAQRHGEPAMEMFEFSSLGMLFLAAGTLYMLVAGIRLIPTRRGKTDLEADYGMGDYVAEIVLRPEAKSVGKTVADSPLVEEVGVEILDVIRGKKKLSLPPSRMTLKAGDVLRVVGDVEQIRTLQEREGIRLRPRKRKTALSMDPDEFKLIEAVIAPDSDLEGKTLKELRFKETYGALAVAIRHRGKVRHTKLSSTRLQAGDVLLLTARKDRVDDLKGREGFVFVSEVGLPGFRTAKMVVAVATIAAVVATAALNIFPIVVSAIAGCVVMILSRCLTLEEAYEAIEWKVIFLLAGVLTLGIALERSGIAHLLAGNVVSLLGDLGPLAVLSAFYLMTTLLSEAMSNNASAALIAPIAISAAEAIGVSPRPFLFAVAFAASSSFMTPVGYQTNTMIYGVGQYTFSDFVSVGTPLNLLFWIIATFMIPMIWPF